jgi:IQ and ubiquitin-like domain-containing protein
MSGLNENKRTLTVKIQLPEDSENVLAVNFPNTFNISNLKEDIAKKFKVAVDQLAVYQNEAEIHDKHMLCHLNLNDFGIIEIKLKLTDAAINDGTTLDTSVYYSSFTLPDIITVHVPIENEDGEMTVRDLVVEIENKSIKKPFLGGYVHKKTSKIR